MAWYIKKNKSKFSIFNSQFSLQGHIPLHSKSTCHYMVARGCAIQKGFTLIELIVVISIIGILSTVLVANFMQVRYKTRDAVRKKDLEQIRLSLESYRTDVGSYPASLYSVAADADCPKGNSISSGSTTYMKEIPCDPREPTKQYYYEAVGSSRLQYVLYACAENENDQTAISDAVITTHCAVADNWNEIGFKVTNP